ncbi:hypothetical protein CN271_18920 [Bacillus cereus]|nr:hypothetical protein CON59_03400 [Bacillus cereus]PET51462.1 hypothetical protein CN523_03090 [Bacillus cereus]PEV85735.1 hypothetical protein CN429_05895 [Bacillus cereus]PFA55758.1 hypothetical protein CN389_14915 [Bacillus cereus]PFD69586.1 hypothetical protein CN271_18920 [Bacillus cereus]
MKGECKMTSIYLKKNECIRNLRNSPYRRITLTVPCENKGNLKNIFQVEPQYINQALAASHAFQGAIDSNLHFNYERAYQIGVNMPGRDYDPSMWGINQPVIQETLQVSTMINQLKSSLNRFLYFIDISNELFWNEVESAIVNTFTNLYTQQNSAWIFYHSSTSTSTSYYYNIMFALQDSNYRTMIVIPIAFDITVRLEKQKVLFITLKDRAEYRVTLKSIWVRLILQKTHGKQLVDCFNF